MKRSLLLLILSVVALAQDVRLGEVSGEVLDMMSKPVVGAQIVYTNIGNGKVYRFRTGPDGKFSGVGLILGIYNVEITGPTGKHIYSGQRGLYAGDKKVLNVISIDLSIMATKASLGPFKGPGAADLQHESRRRQTQESLNSLGPEQAAQLRDDNALIARYNQLTPQIQSAIAKQDWEVASRLLQELIVVAPYKWELYQNLGTIQMFLGNYREAIQTFEKGIQVLASDPETGKEKAHEAQTQMMMAQAEAYAALNELDAATAQYKKVEQFDPKLAVAHAHLCVVAYNNGHSDAAITACKQAIQADPKRPEFYQTLAQIQSNLEKYEDAIQTYEQGIRVAEMQMRQARSVHTSIESIKESHRGGEWSGAAAARSRIGQMLLAEGNAWFQLRKFKQAAEFFTQATAMHPYPALAYFNLCVTWFDMDNLTGAIEACDKAIALSPGMADAYFVKASALLGDAARRHNFHTPQNAIAALQKYLQLAPEGGYSSEANAMLKEMAARH